MGKTVEVTCPICKTKKKLNIPESNLNQGSTLLTISIPKGIICKHHFQMFLDKNYKIRGYQKVDFELEKNNLISKAVNFNTTFNNKYNDKLLFESLEIGNKQVKFNPKTNNKIIPHKSIIKQNTMSLKDIYNEFWEFIDENNEIFQDYINRDKRRKKNEITVKGNNMKDKILNTEAMNF